MPIVYLRLFVIALMVLPMALTVLALQALGKQEKSHRTIRACTSLIGRTLGVRVKVLGKPYEARPLMMVSNHTSYLDILAYGAALPIVFTPKSEIANWPVIGWLCKLVGCVFIERKQSRTLENMERLGHALQQGRPVLLFAEGTTNDGKRLLPFKSSFFNLVTQSSIRPALQPAVIRYVRMHGLPVDSASMPKIAWYGDMELWPHAKILLQQVPIEIEIEFLEPLIPTESRALFEDRKLLAAEMEARIAHSLKSITS